MGASYRSGTVTIRYVAPWAHRIRGSPTDGLARHVADLPRLRRLSPDGAGRGLIGVFEVEGSGLVTDINLVQGWFGEVQRLLPER